MKTFCITTLGCKVNQYESEQIAALLRLRGLIRVESPELADLRVVNTCSVTVQAASRSRQVVRQAVRLRVLGQAAEEPQVAARAGQRTLVVGCWATSNTADAARIPGVSAVLGHADDVAGEIDSLLRLWLAEAQPAALTEPYSPSREPGPESLQNNGWIMQASTLAARLANGASKAHGEAAVKENPAIPGNFDQGGTRSLPQLDRRYTGHQRALIKIQDGCDAHCTYCIIPRLRRRLWSRPVEEVVREARALVEAGHVELVLTGIYLGAYGQETALRRRQGAGSGVGLARLVEALCERVAGLRRLRLSSLEPGDLGGELLRVLSAHEQVMPHFHLPLQSGSDRILGKMNRQYRREDYLRMVDGVRETFDAPALTTDILVGFPGEDEQEFGRTMEVVERVGFIHIHAFPFSPRPGTAAARWQREFVPGATVNERLAVLQAKAAEHSLRFRRQFVGRCVEVVVERGAVEAPREGMLRSGRSERYFPVRFAGEESMVGKCVRVRVEEATPDHTRGRLADGASRPMELPGRPA